MLPFLNRAAAAFLLLLFYSFLGWCGEMIYCAIGQRKLCEKRGFLNGPLCPIYGHGALLVLLVLGDRWDSPPATFLVGMVLTSAVEYVTSYAMEKLFHMRWWDYSQRRFQLNGRVCLLNSLLFGLACLVLRYGIQPRVYPPLAWLRDHHLLLPLALVLFLLYAADIVLSVRSAIQIGSPWRSSTPSRTSSPSGWRLSGRSSGKGRRPSGPGWSGPCQRPGRPPLSAARRWSRP